jgi:glycosyltransferase involved in cell wall biosynthesis
VLLVRRYGTAAQRLKYALYAGLGLIYALGVQAPRGNAKAVLAKARGIWHGLLKPLPPPPAKPLNVLWLIDHVCYDGSLHGGGRLYMNLMPRFDPAQIHVHPYFLRASDEVRQLFADAGHPVRTLGLAKYDLTAPFRIAALCRRHRIDVMHLYCYASSTFGRMVSAAKGLPAVVHDFDTQIYFPYPFYLKLLDRMLAPRTDHAFAASAHCKEYMRDVRHVPGDRIEVLYHAVPGSLLELLPRLDRAGARATLGLSDELVFCAITKLGPERGNETLLTAFAKVRQARPDARLILVYQPTLYHRLPKEYETIAWARDPVEMRARMERAIAELELGESVRMVESSVHPEAWYAASDVMMAPFESTRFSSVHLVEAMAYGRPHVATALGEPLELVQRYGGGLTVPAGNVQAMAQAMLSIGNDPLLRAELGRKARLGAEGLTVDAAAARLTRLYQTLHAARRGVMAADPRT